MGAMITYAAYTESSINLTSNAIATIVADTVVSFLAGFAIFPIVFAYALDPAQGPGLMFQMLPIAFAQMPGGAIVGGAFFILLFVSALASAISLLEVIVSAAVEKGIPRPVAAIGSAAVCWILGLGTVFSFNEWSNYFPLASVPGFETKTVFDILDYVTSNIMLTVGGILISLFAAWVIARKTAFAELHWGTGLFTQLWWVLVAFVCPLVIAYVLYAQVFGGGSSAGG
jgi:NSS family neurotransmitter:Na+ symporter